MNHNTEHDKNGTPISAEVDTQADVIEREIASIRDDVLLGDPDFECRTREEARRLAGRRRTAYLADVESGGTAYARVPEVSTIHPRDLLRYIPGQTADEYLARTVSHEMRETLLSGDDGDEWARYLDTPAVVNPVHGEADIVHAVACITRPVLRWADDIQTWMAWDGTRWSRGKAHGDSMVMATTGRTVDRSPVVVPMKPAPKAHAEQMTRDAILAGLAYRVQGDPTVYAVADDAPYMPLRSDEVTSIAQMERITRGVGVTASMWKPLSDFDADTSILATPSGVLDMVSGTITDPVPDRWTTKLTGADLAHLDPSHADAGLWRRNLHEVVDDPEVEGFLQEAFGAILDPSLPLRYVLALTGGGRNGKSTIVEPILKALGDYGALLDPEVVTADAPPDHKTICLRGARLGVISETPPHKRWNATTIKRLTGGDSLQDRDLWEKAVRWEPTHRVVIATNHPPSIDPGESAFWDRYLPIPLPYRFLPADDPEYDIENPTHRRADGSRMTTLKNSPVAQAEILAWLIEGQRRYRARLDADPTASIPIPESIRRESRKTQIGASPLAEFCDDILNVDKTSSEEIPASVLYSLWALWKHENLDMTKVRPNRPRDIGLIASEIPVRYVAGDKNRTAYFSRVAFTPAGIALIARLPSVEFPGMKPLTAVARTWAENYSRSQRGLGPM